MVDLEEKIVSMVEFCQRYNVSHERARQFGIDNEFMEVITEEEFQDIIEESHKLKYGSSRRSPIKVKSQMISRPPLIDLVGEKDFETSFRLSQMFDGDTLSEDEYRYIQGHEPGNYLTHTLLHSEQEGSETFHQILESSIPPRSSGQILLSDNNQTRETSHDLIYTSES